ncbi:D-alanyl-D-alanine carboxypeptidase family protein, partial [Candidatus Saccharibacteria bacterium]|nr:D-alanyl-D-alanine carboxypeptidase family protein [Candidatus Saccharibacteria bacterium]
GYLLQPVISEPWQALKTASLEAGLQMSIVSGYRSVAEQRQLFMSRLYETGVSLNQIANGTADSEIDFILQTTAIPGYSKHHTGYTFDLYCAGFQFEKFRDSTCNTWLAADNYKVAKELGFIPSYPPLSDSQGPNPEAWEYIYVGTELLYE